MVDILIITNHFPYEPGEQFLETEIKFWAAQPKLDLELVPMLASGVARPLPDKIGVDLCLSKETSRSSRKMRAIQALSSRRLRKEWLWLQQNQMLNAGTFMSAWRMEVSIQRVYASLKKKLAHNNRRTIGYSYWFDSGAYGLALLRREGLLDYLVTRAHGFDVYEERRTYGYMPFKRQFVRDFDEIHAISAEGKVYLHERYKIPLENLKVSRLGVLVGNNLSYPSSATTINVVSTSFCVPVKRIDRIIEGIALTAKTIDRRFLVQWTHIGDGELRDSLILRAEQALSPFSNVCFKFLGHLPNAEVLEFYGANPIDIFINTSESEGLPVSIMEAMSCGIPAIAPNVGGMAELVNRENGWLLSAQPSVEEIATAISAVAHYKSKKTRQAARETVLKAYNAEKNYRCFVDGLISRVAGSSKLSRTQPRKP